MCPAWVEDFLLICLKGFRGKEDLEVHSLVILLGSGLCIMVEFLELFIFHFIGDRIFFI